MHRSPALARTVRSVAATAAITLGSPATTAEAQTNPPVCADDPVFQTLDFWVGEWDVFAGEQQVGTNRIEKVLSGCAVIEHWRGAGGREGKSLFYYHPASGAWKQVWVTENALTPGGVKEKQHVETLEGGAVRFQGTISLPGGGSYLDRTTLTPLPDGRVRQVIEVNRDGRTWTVTFDAVYVRRGRFSLNRPVCRSRACPE